jgi:predicted SAM-dependent methyltransferase
MIDSSIESAVRSDSEGLSRVLNLGCGRKRLEGAINIDRAIEAQPDVLHDLNMRPWPLPENHFEEVIANDVLEHLEDVLATLKEIHRICRAGAVVRVAVPHFSSANAYSDPTHRHIFGYSSFDCVTPEDERSFYTSAHFRYRHRQIIFQPTLLNKVIWRLANRSPMRYEHRWAWLFPAWFVSIELEAIKDGTK